MDYIPLVRVGALLPFLPFLKEMGTSVERLLMVAKIPGNAMENADGLIPLHAGAAFLEHASRSEGLRTLGLRVGQHTQIEQLGAFGVLLRNSSSLFQAIGTAQQLITAFNSGAHLWLEQDYELAQIFFRSLTAPSMGRRQVDLYSLMLILNLIRLAAGPDWKPREVWLQMPHDKEVAHFEEFTEARLLFNQPASAITLPRAMLSWPIRHPDDRYACGPNDRDRLQASAPALNLAGSLKQILPSQLRTGNSGIHRMAEVSGISARSLQRRLLAEGMQFSLLVDQVRFDESVRLLADPSIKLKDIARELGYHDSANFTRAFHRWTGTSPQAFRKGQARGGD